MGLGLTISRMIIRQLNGEISVVSQKDIGTTFEFELLLEHFNPNVEEELKIHEELPDINLPKMGVDP